MASTIDDRTGLGWETWWLLALLVGAGGVLVLGTSLVGGVLGEVGAFPAPTPTSVPGLDPRRAVVGTVTAILLAAAAIVVARRTDWRLEDSPSGFDDDLGEHPLLEVIDE